MPRQPKETQPIELFYVQTEKDGRCIDMLLTLKEIEKGMVRATDPNNANLMPKNCATCWPVEKPPKCTFWDKLMFRCSELNKE